MTDKAIIEQLIVSADSYYGICKCYVISTITCYTLTTELWLPETFVIVKIHSFRNTGHFLA